MTTTLRTRLGKRGSFAAPEDEFLENYRATMAAEGMIMSPSRSSVSSRSSLGDEDDSLPPTPTFGPPTNFGQVSAGLYRSSFPHPPHFEHIAKLDLKTVLTLVDIDYPKENRTFLKNHGIKHIQIPVPAHKADEDCIPVNTMHEVLTILCDESNYPMLVHCNKGKHRTGCAIGCYRLMQGSSLPDVLEDYRQYAGIKSRRRDEFYLKNFDCRAASLQLRDAAWKAAQPGSLITPPASDREPPSRISDRYTPALPASEEATAMSDSLLLPPPAAIGPIESSGEVIVVQNHSQPNSGMKDRSSMGTS